MLLLSSIIFDKLPDALILSLLVVLFMHCVYLSMLCKHFKIPKRNRNKYVYAAKIISNLTYICELLNRFARSNISALYVRIKLIRFLARSFVIWIIQSKFNENMCSRQSMNFVS